MTEDQRSADHYQRVKAMLYDIGLIVVCILWPAVSVLQDNYAFDKRAVAALAVFWVIYQWALQRFTGASIGQRLAGYRIVAGTTGRPKYFLRVIYGYVGLVIGTPAMIFSTKNADCVYWWDRKTHTRAVRTRS